jgi:zinc/manganese transport system substrate-binding protein
MIYRVLTAVVSLLAAGACGSPAAPAGNDGPVRVVASTDVYGSIARAVGGDRVAVTSIIESPAADPHEYEATPADGAAVAQAAVVVVNGGGYDDFATALVEATSSAPTVLTAVDLGAGTVDEHVWYSLPTVKLLAERLAAALAEADPADAPEYTRNATAFAAQVDGLASKVAAIRTAHAGIRVAVTEPVPMNLLRDAGLENAMPAEFTEAVEEGADPPAAVLQASLELVGGGGVRALLVNAQTESASTRQVEQAATAAGVPVVTVAETLPEGVDDYVAWQGGQIDALAAALDTAA